MFSTEFWQTFVQLLSFNGYILPEELHHYQSIASSSDKSLHG